MANLPSPLFDRVVRIALDNVLIEDMHVQFKIKKTLKKEPNTAEIQIYNLNENHRSQLQQHKIKVVVEAGYAGILGHLFAGDSRYVDQKRDRADWITKIQCGDGERNYQYRRVAASFSPGTSVTTVAKTVANSMGFTINNVELLDKLPGQFLQGHSAYGKASTELDNLLSGRGIDWSIQDGQIQLLPTDSVASNEYIVLRAGDDNSGLVGSPEHGNPEKDVPLTPDQYVVKGSKKRGPPILKVKALLQPGLRPGKLVKIESRGINGFFRIQTVTHTGATAGGEWYSELECIQHQLVV